MSLQKRTFRTAYEVQDESNNPIKLPKNAKKNYYKLDENEESLDEWLESFKPSQKSSGDGIDWIMVFGKTEDCQVSEDVIGFQKAWQDLVKSKAQITHDSIKKLALIHNVTSGKWMIFTQTGTKIDTLWRTIATNVIKHNLDGFSSTAKVSPYNPEKPRHVICVYNRNYTNVEEIFRLEKAIRAAGVNYTMCYKPDVFTYCGIYQKNPWNLRPILYKSEYKLKNNQSEIKSSDGILIHVNDVSCKE